MTKSELLSAVADKSGVDQATAEKVIGALFDTVGSVMKAEEKVAWPGFGTFSGTTKAARTGRNPSPGALYTTLHRMETKGLVTSRDGSPTPERGGRAKRFVAVTREGRTALASAQSAYRSLLEGLDLLTTRTFARVPTGAPPCIIAP